jgi:hypothetical protein
MDGDSVVEDLVTEDEEEMQRFDSDGGSEASVYEDAPLDVS